MKKEDLFACLDKAGEVFAQQTAAPSVETEEEDDFELQMQEEELARIVAAQMGFPVEE